MHIKCKLCLTGYLEVLKCILRGLFIYIYILYVEEPLNKINAAKIRLNMYLMFYRVLTSLSVRVFMRKRKENVKHNKKALLSE